MQRVLGFLLVVRALTPILIALTILWGVSQIAGSLRQAVEPPLTGLKTEIDALGPTLNTAWQNFESAASTALGGLAGLASRLGSFNLPTIQAGQLGVFLGGVAAPLNGLLQSIEQVFHPLGDALSSLGDLGQSMRIIPDQLKQVVDQGELAVQQLRAVIERWSGLLVIAVIVILGLVAVYNLASFLDDFRRGWRLLTNRGDG
ncbi:MAG: hypothetical protein HY870_08955 [Chloroflexi bacterium]|nr:hypothetical protein [Chloroflexota bacterium]